MLKRGNTGCFQHQHTDFGRINLDVPKLNLESYLNYQKE